MHMVDSAIDEAATFLIKMNAEKFREIENLSEVAKIKPDSGSESFSDQNKNLEDKLSKIKGSTDSLKRMY